MVALPTPAVRSVTDALSAPFEPREIKFKPQIVKNNKALAIAYVDVRLIEDRLDDVLGVENWQDDYDILPDGSVTCKLRVNLGGEWVTKMDVGSPSEQPDGGDRLKAAFSDALKRAAVKFGIGRYLYRLPAQWVDYDPAKKQIVRPPQLPAFAVPAAKDPAPKPTKPGPQTTTAAPVEKPAALPADGAELHRRLQDYDAKLAAQKLSSRGALLAHVTQAGIKAGYSANLTEWSGAAIAFAADAVKAFDQAARAATAA
ncbi:Rad52/Rad22 family DNA repair protein [Urbifossiella limnaea]|uniref:Single-stranded DNA-binding protein DdrA n=1 Tax=Urbifossiella limnaea TaxID=2528023 RepID=A0A517XYZ3_9BACT|nr:Rad52/Rad22 family DNA repair protein [Urbifossiella limnaea]QDU22734.1 Single-stranded DNA-binding protein DdrA [Urbifossiella limnaea]